VLRLRVATALIVMTGCGAKVVFEDEGSGGSGAASASTSAKSGSTKSTGTAASCTDLEQSFQNAVAAAAACNPPMSSPQCTTIINDTCGCPTIALNTKLAPLVNEAKLASTSPCGGRSSSSSAGRSPAGTVEFIARPEAVEGLQRAVFHALLPQVQARTQATFRQLG
jgi:hypothetical protein